MRLKALPSSRYANNWHNLLVSKQTETSEYGLSRASPINSPLYISKQQPLNDMINTNNGERLNIDCYNICIMDVTRSNNAACKYRIAVSVAWKFEKSAVKFIKSRSIFDETNNKQYVMRRTIPWRTPIKNHNFILISMQNRGSIISASIRVSFLSILISRIANAAPHKDAHIIPNVLSLGEIILLQVSTISTPTVCHFSSSASCAINIPRTDSTKRIYLKKKIEKRSTKLSSTHLFVFANRVNSVFYQLSAKLCKFKFKISNATRCHTFDEFSSWIIGQQRIC